MDGCGSGLFCTSERSIFSPAGVVLSGERMAGGERSVASSEEISRSGGDDADRGAGQRVGGPLLVLLLWGLLVISGTEIVCMAAAWYNKRSGNSGGHFRRWRV